MSAEFDVIPPIHQAVESVDSATIGFIEVINRDLHHESSPDSCLYEVIYRKLIFFILRPQFLAAVSQYSAT